MVYTYMRFYRPYIELLTLTHTTLIKTFLGILTQGRALWPGSGVVSDLAPFVFHSHLWIQNKVPDLQKIPDGVSLGFLPCPSINHNSSKSDLQLRATIRSGVTVFPKLGFMMRSALCSVLPKSYTMRSKTSPSALDRHLKRTGDVLHILTAKNTS